MVAQIAAQSGPLHCLVNNASSFEPDSGNALDVDGARQQFEVNLLAPLALSSLMAQTTADEPAGAWHGPRAHDAATGTLSRI